MATEYVEIKKGQMKIKTTAQIAFPHAYNKLQHFLSLFYKHI